MTNLFLFAFGYTLFFENNQFAPLWILLESNDLFHIKFDILE